MMRDHRKDALFLLVFGVTGIWHQTLAAEFHCSRGDLMRRIEVVSGDPAQAMACEVRYWRDASSPDDGEVIWRASQDPDFCDPKARDLVGRLRAGGWTCMASDEPERSGASRAADVLPSTQSTPLPSGPVSERQMEEAGELAESAPVAARAEPPAPTEPQPVPMPETPAGAAREPAGPPPVAAAREESWTPVQPTALPAETSDAAMLDQVVEQTLRSVQQLYGGDFRAEDATFGDLDGDGRNDADVLVTYQADRNDYVQYLVAYLFEDGTFQSIATKNVGGRFRDTLRADVEGIVDRAIVLDLHALDESAVCCENRRAAFVLKEGQLVEVKDPGGATQP